MRLAFLLLIALLAAPASAQPVWHVDANATGANTGQSWTDAFTDLQSALAVAEAGEEVWVAEGLYTPTSGSYRTVSFVLVSGVALYGGFDGTEQNRDERDWTKHETILSGDVGVPGDSLDNSYNVLTAIGTDSATVLDGFTVQHGKASVPTSPYDRGAGLYAPSSDIVVRNCRFRWNVASVGGGAQRGAGIYFAEGAPLVEDGSFEQNIGGGGIYDSGGSPTLRRLVLRGNRTGQLFFENGSNGLIEDVLVEDGPAVGLVIIGSSPRFVRVTVRNNRVQSADGGGALIVEEGAAPVFEDCLFEGNRASRGSAAAIQGIASALFLRTTFRGNPASSDGAVSVQNSDATFLFCRFERNRGLGTGGIFATQSGIAVLASRFVGNTAPFSTSGGGALLFTGSTFTGAPVVVASSLFVGNEANEGGAIAAFGVNAGEALVVNSTFAGNEGREAGGAIYASNAPGLVIQNSVLWGNTAPEGPEVYVAQGDPPMIAQSLVAGGYPSGTMILDADPLFVRNPDPGPDGNWGTADDDYGDLRLLEGSPAVDYGLAAYLPADTWDLDGDGDTEEPLPVDLAGGPRVLGEAPDLGAYEGAIRVANERDDLPEEADALRVWPNPATTVLRIQTSRADGNAEAVLLDVLGRDVRRVRLGEGVGTVDVSDLAAGVYVVRVGSQSAVVTVRQ